MRRSILPFLILTLLTACGEVQEAAPEPMAEAFWPSPETNSTPKVLLIGIDGIRVDVMREVPTPNMDALAAAGAFSEEAQNVRPTVSGPCWSSILIGVGPEKHGVVNNDFSTNQYADYPDFLTRIEMVKPELGTFAAIDWLPLGADAAGGPLIGDAVDRKVVLDGYEFGWLEADSISVVATVNELRTGNSDALFVYMGAPDEISHNIGGIGLEYRDAIAAADRHVGRLVEAVKNRPTFPQEDWLILVVTDHGRTETGGHGGDSPEETTVFYLASGPSAQIGTPEGPITVMDFPVTALTHLGIQIDPAWGLDGHVVGLPLPADTLRILAYNTHHGAGMDGVLDLERIAGVIRAVHPDVVTLQEIDQRVERTGGVDQAATYGSLTGMEAIFGDFMPYQGGEYGMALLSRHPIVDWENRRLPPGAEPRTTLAAKISLPGSGREVWVAGIHFYRTEEERLAQARQTASAFSGVRAPVFLVGDFNSQPHTTVLNFLEEEWDIPTKEGVPFTFPADGPEREIDFILVRPGGARYRVLEYRVLEESVASDHRPIFMVVELF